MFTAGAHVPFDCQHASRVRFRAPRPLRPRQVRSYFLRSLRVRFRFRCPRGVLIGLNSLPLLTLIFLRQCTAPFISYTVQPAVSILTTWSTDLRQVGQVRVAAKPGRLLPCNLSFARIMLVYPL
jgi:hypothetical protein